MVLEWTPEEASLYQDPPFSAAASVYISREAWETLKPPDIFQHQFTGCLGTREQETLYDTCATAALLSHHSTIDISLLHLKTESLRDSEPPNIFLLGTRAPRDRVLHEV